MSDDKEIKIYQIENGFLVQTWTPAKQYKIYCEDLDAAHEVVKAFFGVSP
jgi:hypothetical protein